MTQDEIIEMAREIGLCRTQSNFNDWIDAGPSTLELVEFAKLVAAHTLMNIDPRSFMSYQEGFEAGASQEREAIIDLVAMYGGPVDLEATIRARGEA